MPDWKTLVLERLKRLGLSPTQEEEIVSELAGHLEDCYEEFRTQGVGKSEAIERSLEQVADWPNLARKLRRAKRKEEMMNRRTKTLWLPALISLATAMVFLMVSTQIVPGASGHRRTIRHFTHKYDEHKLLVRGLPPMADSFAILWCCGRLFIAPCRGTTPGARRSRSISLDGAVRFGYLLDPHRRDCAPSSINGSVS
jgi:hypothetical protein